MDRENMFEKSLERAVIISFILMMITVILQVVSRYALPWSPAWTEELARFCFVYMVSLGAGLAVKDKAYVRVSIIFDKISRKAGLILENVILGSLILLMAVMLYYSFSLMQVVTLQQSASMKVNMAFIYFSMTAMSSLVLAYAAIDFFVNLKLIKASR